MSRSFLVLESGGSDLVKLPLLVLDRLEVGVE